MFVELKRFFEGHGLLESTFLVSMVIKPESDIAAFSLFLAIRASLIHQEHAQAIACINMLLAQLPIKASREDREYLLWLRTECERMSSAPPTQK